MSGFPHRLACVLLAPFIATGLLGHYLLGDDTPGPGLATALVGNVVWLIVLTMPLWAPIVFLRWLVTGKSL